MGQIYAITPFTLLDFPGETACITWFTGCNLRCVYCHNPDLIFGRGQKTETDLLDFLERRRGLLTGVVFSGGEATFAPALPRLMEAAKELGYRIKLDTNGTRPDVLARLADNNLLDAVALDYKCPASRVTSLLGQDGHAAAFREGLRLLIRLSREKLRLEIRTTYHSGLMTEEELASIMSDLDAEGFKGTYVLQNIVSYGPDTLGNIDRPQHRLDPQRLPSPRNFKLAFRNFPGLVSDATKRNLAAVEPLQ